MTKVDSMEEFKEMLNNKTGFASSYWDITKDKRTNESYLLYYFEQCTIKKGNTF